jgi:hypothetical protein
MMHSTLPEINGVVATESGRPLADAPRGG